MIMALLGSCPSHVTRMEAKFLHLAKSIKPVNGGPGLESELCLALACSYCILSHARDLHTLSCPAMPSLVCCCSLWFPGRPCLCGAHGHWNGKGPSPPCFLLTFPRSAQQSKTAWWPNQMSGYCAFLPFRVPHHLPTLCLSLGFPTLPSPMEQSYSNIYWDLSTGELYMLTSA